MIRFWFTSCFSCHEDDDNKTKHTMAIVQFGKAALKSFLFSLFLSLSLSLCVCVCVSQRKMSLFWIDFLWPKSRLKHSTLSERKKGQGSSTRSARVKLSAIWHTLKWLKFTRLTNKWLPACTPNETNNKKMAPRFKTTKTRFINLKKKAASFSIDRSLKWRSIGNHISAEVTFTCNPSMISWARTTGWLALTTTELVSSVTNTTQC